MPENAATARQMSILIVDDQAAGLLAVEAVLQPLGQRIVRAGSGRAALRQLLREDVALILLDVQMPDMDGYETAALIRQRESLRYTPIIFLTAHRTGDVEVIHGYDLGAVDYIFKPLDPVVLRAKVSAFVELARKSELIREQAEQLREQEQEARRLAAARAELLDQLACKHRELQAVNQELEAFSYSAAHDLRDPASSVYGFSELLLNELSGTLGERHLMCLRQVQLASLRMTELIDDLLELSKVSRGALERQPVDFSELARSVAETLERSRPGRSVSFRIDKDLRIDGDPRLLRIVLENLVGNALKFTERTPEPRIEIAMEVRPGGNVYRVRDNGAGFDMARVGRLFAPFQRLHPEAEFPGTGIGLATVRRIIERHGGRVWAEGAVGQGATVFFTAPGKAE
jgi:two-component system, sensor histidine kinase and response regulator